MLLKPVFSNYHSLFIIVILSLFFSFLILAYLVTSTENSIKNSVIENQKEKQRQTTEKIALNIGQTLTELRTNLKALAFSKPLQNGDFTSNTTRKILESTFQDLDPIIDRIMILDKKDVVSMDINEKEDKSILGTDFSYSDFVQKTRIDKEPLISNGFTAIDDTFQIAINYPIVNFETGEYMGMISTRIGTAELFSRFGNIHNQEKEFILAYDKNSNLLATPSKNLYNQSLIGTNFFSNESQNIITNENGRNVINNLIHNAISTGNNLEAIYDSGLGNQFVTEYPIVVDDKPLYFVNYVTPYNSLLSDILDLFSIEEMQLFLLFIITGLIVMIALFIILRWNKELNKKIKERTTQLYNKTNDLNKSLKSLETANEQLEINDKIQKEFINIAAHELRTPTQSIIGYLEMVKSFPENFKKYWEPLERNSQRLYQLSEDILDIARIESNNLNLNKEKFDIYNLIKETIDDFTNKFRNARKNDIKILYLDEDNNNNYADGKYQINNNNNYKKEIFVYADRIRIQQVISNLLTNAYKFTENGIIIINIIKRSNKKNENKVTVSIKDTGKGIDQEILPKLFEKFITKSGIGTGLGLYISRNIVEAHGGKIRGYNNTDGKKGATFEFTFPIQKR